MPLTQPVMSFDVTMMSFSLVLCLNVLSRYRAFLCVRCLFVSIVSVSLWSHLMVGLKYLIVLVVSGHVFDVFVHISIDALSLQLYHWVI